MRGLQKLHSQALREPTPPSSFCYKCPIVRLLQPHTIATFYYGLVRAAGQCVNCVAFSNKLQKSSGYLSKLCPQLRLYL